MKVSLVSSTLSTNPMIRVYPFAKFLQDSCEVEVIGPSDKRGVYPPLQEEDLNIKSVRETKFFPFYIKTIYEQYKLIDADIIHAFKPKICSYGVSLLKKISKKTPIVLDLDDWESQHMWDNYFSFRPFKLMRFLFADMYIPESYFSKKFLEMLHRYADEIIVDSFSLQKLFGGTYIPSGANVKEFDPEKINGSKIRKRYGINKNDILISFIGNPKQHKGINELIKIFKSLKKENENIKFLIVGADNNDPYVKKFLKKEKGILLEGYRPHHEIPYYIAASDIMPLPQKDNPAANAQMPYKVFELMAMAKAIVATDVADMKVVLGDCGKIIPKENPLLLKKAILEYAENKRLRKKHGQKARRKCVKEYSWDLMKKRTLEVYERLI